ncbi:MAG: DUF2071 domain-containing protein [Verrucomicrobiales bacterium]|nr:DUF2071 domain-containing protein [Verrucomicrobiales bacterium]
MKQATESLLARDEMAGRRFETMFLADWLDFAFLHFEVDPEALQQVVPFSLDLHEGKAFVSLVAFTMKGMRFARGGAFTRWMTAPIATHRFLNLRTYVQCGEGRGIYFMQEWMNNRFALPLGPRTFGLPYRLGRMEYDNAGPEVKGAMLCGEGAFQYSGRADGFAEGAKDPLEAFLLERYVAFASARKVRKFFRVWHEPWRVRRIGALRIVENTLFDSLQEDWTETASLVSGHQSAGVNDVWMSRPHTVQENFVTGFHPQFSCKGPDIADSCHQWKTTLSEKTT